MSAERTEGYVIRWQGILEPRYYRRENMPCVLAQADVMSLRQASVALRQAPISVTNAEIVRVRCVARQGSWRLATPEEADGFGYSYEYGQSEREIVYRFAPRENGENSPMRHLRIRVPGEPRWEIVEE